MEGLTTRIIRHDQPLAPTNRHATLTWRCSTRCPGQRARKQHRRRTAHCARWQQPHRSCRQKLASRRVRLSGHRRRDPGKGRQSAEYGSAATGRKCCPGRSRLARRQTEPDLRQTRRQVVQMMHPALACQLPQPLAIGREVAAQQPRLSKQLLNAMAPNIGAAAQTLQDHRHFAAHPRLALAAQTAGIVHQQQIAAQRKTLQHPFPPGPLAATVFHRAQPEILLHVPHRTAARDTARAGRLQIVQLPFRLRVLDPLPNGRCLSFSFSFARLPAGTAFSGDAGARPKSPHETKDFRAAVHLYHGAGRCCSAAA